MICFSLSILTGMVQEFGHTGGLRPTANLGQGFLYGSKSPDGHCADLGNPGHVIYLNYITLIISSLSRRDVLKH